MFSDIDSFMDSIAEVTAESLSPDTLRSIRLILGDTGFNAETVSGKSMTVSYLAAWVHNLYNEASGLIETE
jgi:hypothetical protein